MADDEYERARLRSGVRGERAWQRRRRTTGFTRLYLAREKAKWLAQERERAKRITLTPEEIAEDEGHGR